MNNDLLKRILFMKLRKGDDVDITVTGISMEPLLYAGDIVTLRHTDNYEIGDILAFVYKNGELLIHRLLEVKNGRYYCKGDNALRLEDITLDQIAGKAVLKNGAAFPSPNEAMITLSLLVNRAFRKSGYRADETRKSDIYRFYQQYMRKTEDLEMTYKINDSMDYISADATSLAVFDPESGDTHFFDETGIDILNCLNTPCTMQELLNKLCEIYDATADDIRADVYEFLAECISKRVVIVQ